MYYQYRSEVYYGTVSDSVSAQKIYNFLYNDSKIKDGMINFFCITFTGGFRYGFCFLYDGKKHGTIVFFHFDSKPYCINVYNKIATAHSWD